MTSQIVNLETKVRQKINLFLFYYILIIFIIDCVFIGPLETVRSSDKSDLLKFCYTIVTRNDFLVQISLKY